MKNFRKEITEERFKELQKEGIKKKSPDHPFNFDINPGELVKKRQLTKEGHLAKQRLLLEASEKNPIRLIQFDGFFGTPGSGDDVMKHGKDGWASMSGSTIELFNGIWDARVFYKSTMEPKDVASFLREVANWIEKDEFYPSGPWLGLGSDGIHISDEPLQEDIIRGERVVNHGKLTASTKYVIPIKDQNDRLMKKAKDRDKKIEELIKNQTQGKQ